MATPKSKLPNRPVVREELESPELHDLSHIRDQECIPVAFKLIELLAGLGLENFQVGSHVNEKEGSESPYLPIMRKMMLELIKNNVKVSDADYVFALAIQAIEAVKSGISEALNQNMNRITEVVYGLPLNDFYKVTTKQLNDVVQRREKIEEVWKPILLDESLSKELE